MDLTKSTTTLIQSRLLRSQYESTNDKDNFCTNNLEEMSEVSLQLGMIRKKHDILKQENEYKRQNLNKIIKDIEQIGQLTTVHSGDQSSVESNYNIIQANLQSHKIKLEEETANSKTYKQMHDRMNEDKISLDLKSNELHKQLSILKKILSTERQKCKRNFESIHSSRTNLKNIRSMVDFDNKQKLERISNLEKSALSRKEAAQRREERIRKIAEIADIAANENTESQEIVMKQSLILHKIWHSYLRYKLDKKLKGAMDIEDAYQSIRSATGLQNINEIVTNFIGKEENQAQLRKSIEEANRNLDELRKRNEKSKSILKELMLIENNSSAIEFLRKVRIVDDEINNEKKQTEKLKGELANAHEFLDEIEVWSKKTKTVMNLVEGDDVKKIFLELKDIIQKDLMTVGERREKIMGEWMDLESKSTDQLVKSIYQEKYGIYSNRFRDVSQDDSHHSSFEEEDKKKKVIKGKK
ncbi:hypothetical protein SteCoe_25680 [Stentor coeruleus]|uniref:Uncharacterized protein n=1 Tax=Stentor coeruleus TaxID=5963 RepID=A0A1R2BEN1_9CILI|nr:hypothetical protein SteCoe_25680 [Stentor coeruleus]